MSILGTRFEISGTRNGMATITEVGECTTSSVATLKSYETGRVAILSVPRQTGLVAKALDSATLPALQSVGDDQIGGARPNCLQVGKTLFRQLAPVQPVGPYAGDEILQYTRVWQQLSES